MKTLHGAVAACLVLTAFLVPALLPGRAAAADTKIRFILDWKAQGPHAWFYVARDKGYFQKEGLDVVVDQGDGSASVISHVMSGSYDAGFGDMNAIIQAAAQRPGEQPVMVYMIYNRSPFALITKAGGPIKTLKDLEGRTLGVPAGSATHRMLAPLAHLNGVDDSKINIMNVAPNLVEQMLVQNQVDVIGAFAATTYMNLVALHQDPDKDYRWFFYDQYGLDLYSNGVMVSQKLIRDNPQAVAGMLRAINRALLEVAANPDEGVAELQTVEPLTKPDIEKARLLYFLNSQIISPEEKAIGLGDIDGKRMTAAIKVVAAAYNLPRTPAVDEVFSASLLPPKPDRILTAAGK